MTRIPWLRAAALFAVLMVIGTATLAPSGFRGTGAISVSPLCVTCSPTWLADVISNIALFVPLGAVLCALGARTRWSIAIAAMISLLIETLQYAGIPAARTASLADFLANSAGAVVGALLAAHAARLLRPSLTLARSLVVAWTLAAVAGLGASAWAVARDGPSAGASSNLSPSPLPHTPNYGWFSGVTEVARVNGVPVTHRGSGPIIVQMPRTDTIRVETIERGRDEGESSVPIVWIHSPTDTRFHVALMQRNRDVSLQARLNATSIGLTTPRLRLSRVFAADAHDTTTLTMIRAQITDGVWSIRAGSVADSAVLRSASLPLSPILGWSLIQAVVSNDAPIAPLLSAIWLLLWFAPGGWWIFAAYSRHGGENSRMGAGLTRHGSDNSRMVAENSRHGGESSRTVAGYSHSGSETGREMSIVFAALWSFAVLAVVNVIAWWVGAHTLSLGASAIAVAAGGLGALLHRLSHTALLTRAIRSSFP